MKISCLPLDIRPYNYDFLESLVAMDGNLTLAMPDKRHLGFKKSPASYEYLHSFLCEHATQSEALVISLDMYLYGGLFPARDHHHSVTHLSERLDILLDLKQFNPSLKIYASSLVLRTPKYNSSEEEPDYYAHSGEAIFQYGYLTNKAKRVGLSPEEKQRLENYFSQINPHDLEDWLQRRQTNLSLTLKAIEMVESGVIEQLIVPLDDTARYGYTAQDQEAIFDYISQLGVQDRVFVHPGTDESGCTLLTKAYLDAQQTQFSAEVIYSNDLFEHIVPNYEDRPFAHSLRSHAAACGIKLNKASNPDLPLLAINGCGEVMQEAFEVSYGYCCVKNEVGTKFKNVTYHTHRNLSGFAREVAKEAENRCVVVADLAMSNGGETELVRALDKARGLDRISGYAGWNTTCNSLGTALATLVFSTLGRNSVAAKTFLKERLISDWAYQTEVRFPVQFEYLPAFGLSYSDFGTKEQLVLDKISSDILFVWKKNIRNSFRESPPELMSITAPFKRMSGLNIKVK